MVRSAAADETAHETSWDKLHYFPRLPARFTHRGYGHLQDFTAISRLIRPARLVIGFLFVRPRFRYPFLSPERHRSNLGNRYRVRRRLRPLGLSP